MNKLMTECKIFLGRRKIAWYPHNSHYHFPLKISTFLANIILQMVMGFNLPAADNDQNKSGAKPYTDRENCI